eukprot:gene27231-32898_t
MKAVLSLLICALGIVCLGGANELHPPVIDIAPIIHPESHDIPEIVGVLEEIREASRRWGFYNVINHGIDQVLIERIFNESKNFFAAPYELKDSVRRNVNNSRGFADLEYTKQAVDKKEVFDVGPFFMDVSRLSDQAKKDYKLDGVNFWPDEAALPTFKSTIAEYYEAVTKLAHKLISATGLSMRCFPHDFFDDKFDLHSSLLRLNHYPVHMQQAFEPGREGELVIPEQQLGVGRHTDAGGLTVLLQDEHSGLQVYSGTKEINGDGFWAPVDPVPGGLTINVADMLQVWSNDIFKAAEHRVLPSASASRYSVPFFYNPNYDAVAKPLSCQLQGEFKPVYRPIRWGDFRSSRYLGDYGDFGEEIQIEHFRIKDESPLTTDSTVTENALSQEL